MNQPDFLGITCQLLKAREKSHARSAIGFGSASYWLKKLVRDFESNHQA